MKVQEVREMSVDDLRLQERDLRDQIFRMRIQKAMAQTETPTKIRILRRDLAKVLTVLQEKQKA
ncbi:MAG: 50S ribosomal protein L29 [Vicinamibacterales bacterium]|nr:50S ribosomal protein L29 [Vicinamibacterales bacterium]